MNGRKFELYLNYIRFEIHHWWWLLAVECEEVVHLHSGEGFSKWTVEEEEEEEKNIFYLSEDSNRVYLKFFEFHFDQICIFLYLYKQGIF